MTPSKHTHKLLRHKYKNGEMIFFCVKDECKFKINTELSLGKSAECWRCGKKFIINAYSKRQARPHCADCDKVKVNGRLVDKKDVKGITDNLNISERIDGNKTTTASSISSPADELRRKLLLSIPEVMRSNDNESEDIDTEDSDDFL